MKMHFIDRLTAPIAPRWTLRRQHARVASEMLLGHLRHYEGAGGGRRTSSFRKPGGDANAVIGPALSSLRASARDLVRNNGYAESALSTVTDDAVGWGIVPKPVDGNKALKELWKDWAETTLCDADGRHDFYGLQKLVMRTVVESGEVIVRRRIRRLEDGLPIPLQLQVLDPDFIDTSKDSLGSLDVGGRRTIQGVEFDPIGRRAAYWLFPEHPGSNFGAINSVRVPAESVLHIFRPTRPGQVRAPSWFAPLLLRFKNFDQYEDATLMKQLIAACLAIITTDVDGSGSPIGTADDTEDPPVDRLQPGAVLNLPPGRDVRVVEPPRVNDYEPFSRSNLRGIATGIGITYEDFTGDYQNTSFSAARMSRQRHERRVYDWRWRILIPQLCDPAWTWMTQIAGVVNLITDRPAARWTPPPMPFVDPAMEGLAAMRNIRSGITSWSETVRERGYDPDELLAELAADNARFDEKKIVLDSDPRHMTQAGQLQGETKPNADAAATDATISGQAFQEATEGRWR